MGDVQLPLRLSTSYYIGVSTSNLGDSSPTSNATLFTFTKPTLRFFRFTKNETSHGTKDGIPKKVVVSVHWPFFSVVKSRGLEAGSPSFSKDTLSSSSSSSSVNNEGGGIESFASQKTPLETKSSPDSSISPSSVLSKKLFIEKEAESNENSGRKITWDSFGSFISCSDAPKLSSVLEGEKEMEWGISKSFARYDHKLSRSTPCIVVEEGGANFVNDIDDDVDELIELKLSKSDSSSVYGDPPTSLRRSSGSDILNIKAGNMMENSSEISDEEIQCSFDDHDAKTAKASEVAPNLQESKKTVTHRGENPLLVVKLFQRFSVFSPLGLFMGKMLRAIGFSRRSFLTMLWMNLKKRVVLLAAWQINLKVKQVVKNRISGGEVELWKKSIPMGRRCRVPEVEDYARRNGERQLREVADVPMNSDGDEVMAEGSSLHELMEMAAEAPVFNWNSK
ncbi:hypothetical protein COCNU_16G003860 [Cocos nucifera]|uniref:Uncharacterized protein n=1 Tax=Cocos nucifera TaxID=13894 RepID=A0A8K0IYY3_COCNU|nr:hypothetical protein COCNU_16G003860 [Cocos nucifera]